jgi:hypothetical protein
VGCPGKAMGDGTDLFGESTHMKALCRRPWLGAVALALILAVNSGCQTYFTPTGQTLPSGYYLLHPPQYIPDSPRFPLAKEEAGLERATLQQGGQVPVRPGGLPGGPPGP